MQRFALTALLVAVLPCGHATAQRRTGKPWSDMDYGPFLSMTIQAQYPEKNIAYKGILVTLDEATQTHALFDTDLMRFAAAWTGGKIDWRSVVYDGSHNTHPRAVGRQIFGNAIRPGWSLTGQFKDPRPRPYGPLPHGIAHYKGLYLHNDRVVFRYTVAGATVREMPGLERHGEAMAVSRTIEVAPTSNPLTLQVAERPGVPASLRTLADGTKIAVLGNPSVSRKPQKPRASIPDRGLVRRWTFDAAAESKVRLNGAVLVAGHNGQAAAFRDNQQATAVPGPRQRLGGRDFSWAGWVRTNTGGTLVAFTSSGKWVSGGKSLFIRDGKPTYDVGWVGALQARTTITDGQWHHVALTHAKNGRVAIYVDGQLEGRKRLESRDDPPNSRIVFGRTSDNFPGGGANQLIGSLDDICLYDRILRPREIRNMVPDAPQPAVTAVACVNMPAGASWHTQDDSSIRLILPGNHRDEHFKLLIWNGAAKELGAFAELVRETKSPESLQPLTTGGRTRFESLTTQAKVSEKKDAYVIDEITAPVENPWRSWMRFGGFDFFADASKAAICTWNGDVWVVSGLNAAFAELKWKRIATGLFQPLGLKIVDDVIHVCCRDQITVLRDLNGNGETDYFENFNNDHQVTEHFHEFAMDLQTDSRGSFYYAKSARHALDSVVPHHGTLIRVAPDGGTSEIVCNGFRAANGVGIGPNGEMSTSDQEGHWTPANRINIVREHGFYGNMFSFHRGERPTSYEPPVVWLPKNVDRSPAESLWVTSKKWGPLNGSLISTSYGTGQVFLVPYQKVNGVYQGGAVRFPLSFPTGTMRARFHPRDGQLYVCGLFGWSSNKTHPGGFYRIRYTGKPVHMPVGFQAAENGIALTFSEPLDRAVASDLRNYAIKQWNYRWTKNYGSDHYKVSNPRQTGADEVPIRAATLMADRRTVFLEIVNLAPVMQMQISWSLRGENDESFENDFYATINELGPAFEADSVKPVPEIAGSIALAPGLIKRFHPFSPKPDTRISRLAAGAAAAPGRPPAAFVGETPNKSALMEMQGVLRVSRPGEYEFRLQGGGTAVVAVEGQSVVGDKNLKSGTKFKLPRGDHAIRVAGITGGDSRSFVLEWKSDRFGWEPVPPSALRHDPKETDAVDGKIRRYSRTLFAETGCIRCHTLPRQMDVSRGMPELQQTAPSLADAGARFRWHWVREWILNPKSFRPDTDMPVTLHGDLVTNRNDAGHIAAYLMTLGSPDDREPPQKQGGNVLFEDLGCLACHRTTPLQEDDGYQRRSLVHVDAKYRGNALAGFLRKPHRHQKWRRMPDFALTADEAVSLAHWLRQETPDPVMAEPIGDPRRGRDLFVSVGCANCHSIDDRPPRGEMRPLTAKARGCLATRAENRGEAPDFGFRPAETVGLMNFIRDDLGSLGRHIPAEAAERAVHRLNCTACHTRDDKVGMYREILAEEGTRGVPPEIIPPLTWAGEKFRTDWMAAFISGDNAPRLRPHLKIRMPRFGPYGPVIAHGLAHQHAVSPREQPRGTGEPMAETGRSLVGRGGFNCLQCHGVGDQKPTAAFDSLGVNLEHIRSRIRKPFFDRWMLDPPRIDPSTRMPKLVTDETTSLRNIFDGNPRRQFNAIWDYLGTIQPNRKR